MRKYKQLKRGDRVRVYGTSQMGDSKYGPEGIVKYFYCYCMGSENGIGWCNVSDHPDGDTGTETFHRSQIVRIVKKQPKVIYMAKDAIERVFNAPPGMAYFAAASPTKSESYPIACKVLGDL